MIRAVIEKEIGRKLGCPDCLGFLQSLNLTQVHDHGAIVEHLSAQFPWPIEWRQKNTQRRPAISALISGIVPNVNFKASDKVLQFLIPYFDEGAREDELRWCIRSIETFCQEPYQITIVGDRPSWYRGHLIEKPRIPYQKHHSFRDSFSKVDLIRTNTSEINAEVMWLMDDCYFNKPFTRANFHQGRLNDREMSSITSSEYSNLMFRTLAALQRENLPTLDFTSHLPQLIRRDRWEEMCQRFDMPNQIYIWENLYGNLFAENPQTYRGYVTRINKYSNYVEANFDLDSPWTINNSHQGWSKSLRDWLEKKFPNPSKTES